MCARAPHGRDSGSRAAPCPPACRGETCPLGRRGARPGHSRSSRSPRGPPTAPVIQWREPLSFPCRFTLVAPEQFTWFAVAAPRNRTTVNELPAALLNDARSPHSSCPSRGLFVVRRVARVNLGCALSRQDRGERGREVRHRPWCSGVAGHATSVRHRANSPAPIAAARAGRRDLARCPISRPGATAAGPRHSRRSAARTGSAVRRAAPTGR